LLYIADGDQLFLAASNFGQARHPSWSTNLLATPDATVAIGGTRLGVTAELLAGDERLRAWDRFASKYEPYRVYVSRTERQIRVFSLRRREPAD
jgi:deazaflavin-dependent oxidoreductase (nitroreductase family)